MWTRRWMTTDLLDDMVRQMDRAFDATLGGWNGPALLGRAYPAVNVWEDGDRLFVEAEVPGLKLTDLDIEVVGRELSIKGERSELQGEHLTYHRQERGTGKFARFVTLPVDVEADRVEAVLNDGVLTITLPKAESARTRKIVVKTK